MTLLIKNIKQLIGIAADNHSVLKGNQMASLSILENAFLIAENGIIKEFSTMENFSSIKHTNFDATIDANNCVVLPGWIDSHTHLVFATTRELEFVDRIKGLSYEEIAANGGGILNSAKKIALATEDELFESAWQRLIQVIKLGTVAIEIKSGYGLTIEAELKMLRVIKRLKAKSPIPIKATLLAAHAYPIEFKQNHRGYLDLIINELLPQVANENLADYFDVFCEKGFFSIEETDELLAAAAQHNLPAKIHANQLHYSGGVQIGVKHQAISVDHLECVGDEEIEALKDSTTLPVLLPSAAFFLKLAYQPARKIMDANLPVVLASDYNPGSSPSGNMNFVVSLACTQMAMLPEEAINACTINAAYALQLQHKLGSITIGKKANLIITKPINNFAVIPYSFGESVIDKMIINGAIFKS
jgi:imidazolonepropionase